MKKTKKIITILMTLIVMISTMIPAVTVEAATISAPSKSVFYLDGVKNQTGCIAIKLGERMKSTNFSESSIKISNKKIVTLDRAFPSGGMTGRDGTWYFGYYYISLKFKKTGTTTVSYKIGKKTYKTKVTVYPYTNPLKKVKMTKVNGNKNISDKLDKSRIASAIKLTKKVENCKLTLEANNGWKITSVYGSFALAGGAGFLSGGYKKSKVTVKLPTFDERTSLRIYMINTKTGGELTCEYSFK